MGAAIPVAYDLARTAPALDRRAAGGTRREAAASNGRSSAHPHRAQRARRTPLGRSPRDRYRRSRIRGQPRESSSWRRISLVSRIRIDWSFARFVISRITISGSRACDLGERGARELEDDRGADRLRRRRARSPVEERCLAEQRPFGVGHDARARAARHDDRDLDGAAREQAQPVARIVLLEQHLAVGAFAAHEVMLDARELARRSGLRAAGTRRAAQRRCSVIPRASRIARSAHSTA